jgi:hypothetical protein
VIAGFVSMLERVWRGRRRAAVIVFGLIALGVVLARLAVGPPPRVGHGARTAPAGITGGAFATGIGSSGRPPPVSVADRARARGVAGRFLVSCLPFVYGRAVGGSVREATPGLSRELVHERARSTPVERRLIRG